MIMNTTRSIRHVGIVVKRIDDILPFYRDHIGMTVVRTSHEDQKFIDRLLGLTGCNLVTAKLSTGEGTTLLELLEFNSPSDEHEPVASIYHPGISHIALTVSDLEIVYQKLTNDGVKFISPPLTSPDGKARVAFCRDPAGNYLELVEELS